MDSMVKHFHSLQKTPAIFECLYFELEYVLLHSTLMNKTLRRIRHSHTSNDTSTQSNHDKNKNNNRCTLGWVQD